MSLKPTVASISACGTTFEMRRDAWSSGPIPICDLDAWIAFYSSLRDRRGVPADRRSGQPAKAGPYESIYTPWVVALSEIRTKVMAQNGS